MEPNTHSHAPADRHLPAKAPDVVGTGLEGLAAAIDALEAQDLDSLSDAELIAARGSCVN